MILHTMPHEAELAAYNRAVSEIGDAIAEVERWERLLEFLEQDLHEGERWPGKRGKSAAEYRREAEEEVQRRMAERKERMAEALALYRIARNRITQARKDLESVGFYFPEYNKDLEKAALRYFPTTEHSRARRARKREQENPGFSS